MEVLSPGDAMADVTEKIRVYLAAGSDVVFIVDTEDRTVTAHDRRGTHQFEEAETVTHEALPDFTLSAQQLFEEPRPKP